MSRSPDAHRRDVRASTPSKRAAAICDSPSFSIVSRYSSEVIFTDRVGERQCSSPTKYPSDSAQSYSLRSRAPKSSVKLIGLIAARSQQTEATAQVATASEQTHSLQHAPRANLDAVVRGNAASGLVTSLSDALTAWEQASGKRKNVRHKGIENLKGAIAAFAADLLHARNHPHAEGWVYRPLAKGSFTKQAVSARDFTSVRDAWIACALLECKPGYTETVEFDGDHIRTRGKAARFRATPKMLKVCAEHGVIPQNVSEHFTYPPPEHPLVLTRASRRVGRWKEAGSPMEFKRTPRTEALEHRVKELNAFIANHVIRGATHRWFRRIFHEGDKPGFDWNKEGRLYSDGKDS